MFRSPKIPLLLAAAGLLTLTPAAAQTQTTLSVELPVLNPLPKTSDIPFGHPKVRYQQWYEGAQLRTKIQQPVRIVGVEFLGTIPVGATLDMEVVIANTGTNLTGVFAQNFLSPPVVAFPRGAVPPGPTRILFKNHWIYDGQSNVVLDIKIWDNGLGARFPYTGKSTILTSSNTRQQYFIGNATATIANSSGSTGHYGLHTVFLYQEGGSYPYGAGCLGTGNFEPVATSSAVPMPGLSTWTQIVDKAAPGYPAVLLLGVSNTTSSGVSLPFVLNFLRAPNCSAYASWEFLLFTTTVGGGPGTGSARIGTPIPGIGSLGGAKVYTQWLIFDQGAANGNLSASNALMHVVGS